MKPTTYLLSIFRSDLEPLEKIGIKVVGYTRTSFERQMLESVKIQENRNQRYEI